MGAKRKVVAATRDQALEMWDELFQPKQDRSRETVGRLLDATEALLSEGGLDAATVPAIAERAGVSVGVVYRRFPDKDVLLRAVYERFFAQLREKNQNNLELLGHARPLKLRTFVKRLISGMAMGFRAKQQLLRALFEYSRTHRDPTFRAIAQRANLDSISAIANVLMTYKEEMSHPRPRVAIELGMLAVASMLQSVILYEHPMPGVADAEELAEEMSRMFLAYVGAG
ncbi:MAG TPA: TetR/AcrR family transcriptional regulator [Thermoanaerobaculia bacterium]|nr:TetR/AcrR family transcriptional regulator [Thermoanaerobaculia bacterium]